MARTYLPGGDALKRSLALTVLGAILAVATPGTAGRVAGREPGTSVESWAPRWPDAGRRRVVTKRFTAPPGLITRVRVLIGGIPVAGPPELSIVACRGTRYLAGAQKAWLWDGTGVYVMLLLDPGRCGVAGKAASVSVVLTSVGT